MTTPNELEIALQDFISECDRQSENCDDCIVNFALGLSLHTMMIVHVNGKF